MSNDSPSLTARDMTPNLIARHLSPAWFAAVMGTAVVPLALSFMDASWLRPVAAGFVGLAALMFVVLLIPALTRVLLHWDQVDRDLP